jgi:hypothetical protein
MRNAVAGAFVVVLAWALLFAAPAGADSIFDSKGMGKDVIPAVGSTRALGGAVAANLDPLSASLLNPCAAARAKYVVLTAGFAHTSTKTVNVDQEKITVTTLFPSLAVAIPVKQFALMTGLFEEKEGRVSLADTGLYSGSYYDASYKRETSIHTVPLVASTAVGRRLFISAGILFSFCDMREESITDFRLEDLEDTDDVMDTFAAGRSFLGAFALDLGRVQLGGSIRTGADLDGSLERRNSPIGLWSSEDVTISSNRAFKLGFGAEPLPGLRLEADYDRTPWAGLKLAGKALNDDDLERWSLGIQYRGDHIWPASKYPLNLGYHRGPLDWQGEPSDKIQTGEITEEVFSLGTSIPIGQDRASVSLAFEFGTRKAEATSDLEEKVYGVSVSLSAVEAWRKELKR